MSLEDRQRKAMMDCIRCDAQVGQIPSGSLNHPNNAVAVFTYGQYGSTVFDPMDGSTLEMNLCDKCLIHLQAKRAVIHHPAAADERDRQQRKAIEAMERDLIAHAKQGEPGEVYTRRSAEDIHD